MKRLVAFLLSGLLCLAPASAFWQSRDSNYNQNVVAGGGGSPTLTAGAAAIQNPNFAVGVQTIGSLNGSNWPAGAVVVVGFYSNQCVAPTTPTIGGVAATLVVADSGGCAYLYRATMAVSSTDQFAYTSSGAQQFTGVAAVYLTNVTAAPTTTASHVCCSANPQALDSALTVPSGGFGIVFAGDSQGIGTQAWTTGSPSNITASLGDNNGTGFTNYQITMAHTITAGSNTPSVGGIAAFGASMAGGTWGP